MVGRNFALIFEIVDGSARKRRKDQQQDKGTSGGQKGGKKPYQVCCPSHMQRVHDSSLVAKIDLFHVGVYI